MYLHLTLGVFPSPNPSASPGAVRFHPRRSDGGHLKQRDRGARLAAAQLRQQHPHTQLDRPHTAGEAVQGEHLSESVTAPVSRAVTARRDDNIRDRGDLCIRSSLATCMKAVPVRLRVSLMSALINVRLSPLLLYAKRDECLIRLLLL